MEMLADLEQLAGCIGPRGTGTPGEAAAAQYVAARLQALGLPYERHEFRAVASQNAFPLAVNAVALLSGLLYYALDVPLTRYLAAALALFTAPMLWQTIRLSTNPLRPLLPKVDSRNVVAHLEPQGDIQHHAVLLAHLDTNRCRQVWQSSTVRYLEPLAFLTLSLLAALGLLFLAGALLGGPVWVAWAALLPLAYIAGATVSLWLDDKTPFTPGAHDNAASVAVALEIAARLAAHPLTHTRVWLAFTGAEETDHAGLKTLLRVHDPLLRQAYFIGLEGLGSGDLVFLEEQGMCSHYHPHPELLDLACQVAAANPALGVHPARMTMEDETGTLRRRGYKAICIAGLDPATGSLPRWHRPDDTVDSIDLAVMEKAVDYLIALLHALDGELVKGKEG